MITARDKGHINEIITHLEHLEELYKLCLDKEKDWLNNLINRLYIMVK